MEIRNLPVKLTEDEVQLKGQELAEACQKIGDVEVAKKEINAEFKGQLDALDKRVHTLAIEVKTKTELRNVEVYPRPLPEKAIVEMVRNDTMEVVETRTMSAGELADARQVHLFAAGEKKPKDRKSAAAGE